MSNRPLIICILTATVFVLMSLAVAGTAGEVGYFPIEVQRENDSGDSVIVQRGDHLWKISAGHLGVVYARTPSSAEIAPYWRATIDANRSSLRSGNPDLIYPGEEIELPPTSSP